MIQTILIVLVAVVVLIVIIAVLALRYLRADESDTFDDIPDEPRPARRPAPQGRPRPPAPPERRLRQPEQVTEAWAAERPARPPNDRAPSGFRDRSAGARRTGPQRPVSQVTGRRDASGPRPARPGARPAGPDPATSSWDALSDVDYWTELNSDKSDMMPAAHGPTVTGRHGSEPVADIRPAPRRPSRRADSGELPVRERHQHPSRTSQPDRLAGAPAARATDAGQTEQIDVRAAQAPPARYSGDAAASSPDVLGRHGKARSATSHRSPGAQRPAVPPLAQPASAVQPTYPSRQPAPAAPPPLSATPAPNGRGRSRADDDPLTSPSFPAIQAADSRSYRARRSSEARQSATSGQHSRPAAAPGATSHQLIDYSSAPRRTSSHPDGYPVQSAGTQREAASQAAGHQPPAAPAANPYGSYVNQSQPGYSDPAGPQTGYPTPEPSLAAAAYSGYAAGQQSAPADWYPGASTASGGAHAAEHPLGQPADGYLPAAGLGGTGLSGGSHARSGSPAHGHPGIDYTSLRYDEPAYPDAQGALPGSGLAGQRGRHRDQQRYGNPDPGYGQDGYPAYPGYGTGVR